MTELRVVGEPSMEEQPPSVSPEEVSPTPFLVDRQSRGSYYLLPQLLDRISEFETELGDARRAAKLPVLFEASFCSQEPWMVCSVFVQGGLIVAHALASIERILGEPYLYVAQLARDQGTTGDINQLISMGAAWGRSLGIERILAYPAGEGQARLFKRFGLKPIPNTMAMDLRSAPFGGDNE
jgi:hypothetical protein